MAKIDSGVEFNKDDNHNKLTKNLDTNKHYNFSIPSNLYKKVKRKLVENERTLRDVLVESLEKYIKE